jgi:hypothetical protein
MRLLLLILLPLLIFAQVEEDYWVEWNGEFTTPDQREFAEWCYDFGGEELFWIGKSESSWGTEVEKGKPCIGPFQMDSVTALWLAPKMGLSIKAKDIRDVLENNREVSASMAIYYYRYWFDKHIDWLGPGWRHERYAKYRAYASYRWGYRYYDVTAKYVATASIWTKFARKQFN